MRNQLAAIFIIAILQGVVSIPLDKADFTCPSIDGYYPVPGQCSSNYYTCVNGTAYNSTCPGNSIFDPVALICLSPNAASCRLTTFQPTGSTGTFRCPSDGLFPVPGQECTANYITCVNGTAYYSMCPGGAVFDPQSLMCTSSNSSCFSSTSPGLSSTTRPTTPGGGTTRPPSNFTCPEPDGFFTYPGQCSGSYFVCVDSIAYPQQCPGAAIFDEFSSSCVAEQNAYCKQPTTSTTRTSTTITTTRSTTTTPAPTTGPQSSTTTSPRPTGTTVSTPAGPFQCPTANGNYPNPADCSTYYSCANFVPTLTSCPSGLVFNPVILQCDWPFNVPGCPGEEK